MATHLVIVGGGPAGHTAATHAARQGATVTLIERDIVGGAAPPVGLHPVQGHDRHRRGHGRDPPGPGHGLAQLRAELDFDALRVRNQSIEDRLEGSVLTLLESQGVQILRGTGRLKGPHEVVAETADGITELKADAVLLSTGSRPRIPDFAHRTASGS
jgi:dihydrolipoamide dehydrogenase